MAFCLPIENTKKLFESLKSGKFSIDKYSELNSTAERRAYLSEFVGEKNAQEVNALMESKFLLKDWKKGMVTAIKKITGISEEAKRDLLSKVENIKEILSAKDEKQFFSDLTAKRLGVEVSLEQANKITELAKLISDSEAKDPFSLETGSAKVVFANYINDLKSEAKAMTYGELIKNPKELVSRIAGTAKSLKASTDNSAIFRQGWKAMLTNPTIWFRNATQSFKNIAKTLAKKDVMDSLNAEILSDKYYDLAKTAKLDIAKLMTEEPYPAQWIEKVPVLGTLYKSSEVAFTAFVQKTRFDIFKTYIDIARKSGVDLNKTELISIGKMVNSLTGRGHLGGIEPVAGFVNNVFFSPRLLKSNIDILTAHAFQKEVTPFVRKRAAINLVKIISGTAAIMATANALRPGSVETDPRSADFGKIRIRDTRFDISGGMSSLATLASRLLTMSSKSSVTGRVSLLNSGDYGSQTGTDVVYNFFENKLSPASSVVKDLLKGKTFQGEKPTISKELSNLFIPLSITNYQELKENPQSADKLLSIIADGLGISVNTYSPASNWEESSGKELTAFKQKVGEEVFKQANEEFNNKFAQWFDSVKNNPIYTGLSDDDKKRLISKKKADLKEAVLQSYGFRYKAPKLNPLPKL